jgi:hypothetical protein
MPSELDRAYERNKSERAIANNLLDQINVKDQEIRRLRKVIEDAPHDCGCAAVHWRFGKPCNCWKSVEAKLNV